jgi:uracil-DNA glycosylase family 4
VSISQIRVPSYGPDGAAILFVAESPGEVEEREGRPLIGPSGEKLDEVISRYGIRRDECKLMNMSEYRPQHNFFPYLYRSWQLEEGQRKIREYIAAYSGKINTIVPLGREAFNFITGKPTHTLVHYRGSILPCDFNKSIKCIATYHPAFIVRNQDYLPIFDMDICRIVGDSKFHDFAYTKRDYHINPQSLELEEWVARLSSANVISVDIETITDSTTILCVGFAIDSVTSICIPIENESQRYAIERILKANNTKVFHFGIFDRLQLEENGFTINGKIQDTYIGQQSLYAGLPNGLDFLTSIYTREPYYKQEGRSEIPGDTKVWGAKTDRQKLYIYNCKDCCVTFEINEKQQLEIDKENVRDIYQFQLDSTELAKHISQTGLLCDLERRELLEKSLLRKWGTLQWFLNRLANKKDVNVRSPKLKELLYKDLNLPERKKRDKNGKWVVTTDENALVATLTFVRGKMSLLKQASAIAEWEKKLQIVQLILKIRGIRVLLSNFIRTPYSSDGKVRSTFKVGGTETGRWSCDSYIDGTGVNAQTFFRGNVEVFEDITSGTINIDSLISELEDERMIR